MKAATKIGNTFCTPYRISIHAAREGGDGGAIFMKAFESVFQSTPPVKAATITEIALAGIKYISIHAAREGGDGKPANYKRNYEHFNPRRP